MIAQRDELAMESRQRKRIGSRVELESGKSLPAPLNLLTPPPGAQLQVGEAALPVRIDPVLSLSRHDACPDAGQIQGGQSQAQQEAFMRIGVQQTRVLELEAACFVIFEAFLHLKPATIVGERSDIGWLGACHPEGDRQGPQAGLPT